GSTQNHVSVSATSPAPTSAVTFTYSLDPDWSIDGGNSFVLPASGSTTFTLTAPSAAPLGAITLSLSQVSSVDPAYDTLNSNQVPALHGTVVQTGKCSRRYSFCE